MRAQALPPALCHCSALSLLFEYRGWQAVHVRWWNADSYSTPQVPADNFWLLPGKAPSITYRNDPILSGGYAWYRPGTIRVAFALFVECSRSDIFRHQQHHRTTGRSSADVVTTPETALSAVTIVAATITGRLPHESAHQSARGPLDAIPVNDHLLVRRAAYLQTVVPAGYSIYMKTAVVGYGILPPDVVVVPALPGTRHAPGHLNSESHPADRAEFPPHQEKPENQFVWHLRPVRHGKPPLTVVPALSAAGFKRYIG